MTALRARRTRSMWAALAAAIVGLMTTAVFGVVGARTLINSNAGQLAQGASSALPVRPVPHVATGLVATVDDDGRLTSVAVIALRPDAIGGSIIHLAASADVGHGNFDDLQPLATVWEVGGPDAFRVGVEAMTGLSFDVIEVADPARFAQLVQPLGDLTVEFPSAFTDGRTDETFGPGESVLASDEAAAAITATNSTAADFYQEPARAAVWAAVAERVGNGIGSGEQMSAGQRFVPNDLDALFAQLFAGPVEFRSLGFAVLDDDEVSGNLDDRYLAAFYESGLGTVVKHDLAEILIFLGSVAGSRLGAPIDGPTIRLTSALTAADLADTGMSESDVLKAAIDRLLFVRSNVVSVAVLPDEAVPEVTQMVVADAGSADVVRQLFDGVFGEIEVSAASTVIEGVDIEMAIGRSFVVSLMNGDASAADATSDSAPTSTDGS